MRKRSECLLHSAPTHAHSSRLISPSSLGPSDDHDLQSFPHRRRSMLIRIVKALPAPLIDGFDVRGFTSSRCANVDARLGRYLTLAGYAEPLDQAASDTAKPPRRR